MCQEVERRPTQAQQELIDAMFKKFTGRSDVLADALSKTPHAIENDFERMYVEYPEYGVHDRVGVALLAIALGWVPVPTREDLEMYQNEVISLQTRDSRT